MAIKPVHHTPDEQPEFAAAAKAALKSGTTIESLPVAVEDSCRVHQVDELLQEPASPSPPSLDSLARLLRLEKYQSRRSRHVQAKLYQAQIATARTSRLLSIARSAQQTLAECIRSEDKQSFANLHSVFRDAVVNSLGPSHSQLELPWSEIEDSTGYPDSFVDALPSAQRTALLEFLSSIRGEPSYVADRLSALTQKELLALLPDRNSPKSSESVFDPSGRSASRVSRNLGYVVDGQTDLLTTLEPTSPLEALIQSTRSLEKELRHDTVAKDVWATACGRLVLDQKRGMEKVVPAVIDIWSASTPWPGGKRLEAWIGSTLQSGAFILEQPSRQSFRVRVQGRQDPNAEDEAKAEEFLSKAIHSLLELLADATGASVIPEGALTFCQEICSRIELAGQRDAFCNFVLTRWLFNSFVVDCVTLPETHSMATERFISDNARQRILREVVLRTQKAVYHVLHPWKHTSPPAAELVAIVREIAGRFRAPENFRLPLRREPESGSDQLQCATRDFGLLAVSISDAIFVMDSLHPQRRAPSLTSDPEIARSGLQSSASSVSGFSLFPTPNSSNTTLAYPFNWPHEAAKTGVAPDPDTNEGLVSIESVDIPSPAELEASRLRDVRTAIEDLTVSGRFPSDRQFAIICSDNAKGTAVTQAMRMRRVRSNGVEGATSFPRSTAGFTPEDHELCENTIREILLETQEGSTLQGMHTFRDSSAKSFLLEALDRRVKTSQHHGDFVRAHSYLAVLIRCDSLFSADSAGRFMRHVLRRLEDYAETSLKHECTSAEECELQLKVVQQALAHNTAGLREYDSQCDLLRDKMLYIADVRTSAAYDEVRSVASALKVMGKPRKPLTTRMAPPLRHWSGSRVSSTNLHLKTEAQILELLSASADHGGPNKLSDDQSKVLAAWLEKNEVQNICIGEERLQKLCMEVVKAVAQLTAETSPLWSSSLFPRNRAHAEVGHAFGAGTVFWPSSTGSRFDILRLHTNVPANRDALSSTASSHPLSARSSRDYLETRSPTLTSRSSAPFWSPTMTEAMSPSSATSVGSSQNHSALSKTLIGERPRSRTRQEAMADTRRQITSLLLSEIAASLFNDGSETDRSFWTGLGGDIAERHLRTLRSQMAEAEVDLRRHRFDFQGAFETLIRQFTASCDPATKLKFLVEVDSLLGLRESTSPSIQQHKKSDSQSKRRETKLPISDTRVNGFRMLFCHTRTRPTAIFRDLQYIAALIPSIAVEYSARSTAFWHASLAITRLKKEMCNVMVETADSIIAYHSNNRGHGRTASSAQQQRDSAAFPPTTHTPPAADIATASMADAAHLLQITAREGDAVAQRELATLYLTHPELMEPLLAPLARPREVFSAELEGKWRRNRDPARCDPAVMCVAHHWMSLSARNGDALAREYLKQREEMERLP